MKKKIAVAAVIVGIGIAGINQAYGGWGKRGGNFNDCPMIQGGQYAQIDPALQEKRDKFFTDTQELRKQMIMKQAEKQAMLRGDNPDPQAVSKLSGELFDLRTSLRQKAEEAGLPGAFGPMAGRGSFGQGAKGRGYGQGMQGRGNGPGMQGRGFTPGMDDSAYGPGMGRGRGGRNVGYMGTPGYGQNRF